MPREAIILAGVMVLLLALIAWLATCRCAFSGLSKSAIDNLRSTETRSARRVCRLLVRKKQVLSALAIADDEVMAEGTLPDRGAGLPCTRMSSRQGLYSC